MLNIFMLLCSLMAGQWVGEQVSAALPRGQPSSWCWSFFVQYLLAVATLVVFDHALLVDAFAPAIGLTLFVRIFFFIKNLKAE